MTTIKDTMLTLGIDAKQAAYGLANLNTKTKNAALNEIATSYSRPAAEVKKHYNENNLIEKLREDLKQRKVIDFLIKNADIK